MGQEKQIFSKQLDCYLEENKEKKSHYYCLPYRIYFTNIKHEIYITNCMPLLTRNNRGRYLTKTLDNDIVLLKRVRLMCRFCVVNQEVACAKLVQIIFGVYKNRNQDASLSLIKTQIIPKNVFSQFVKTILGF